MNTYEDDLWFLPGPPEDMAPTDPPWPTAPQRPRVDPKIWQNAERDVAALLADTAETIGRLNERLHHMPDGVAHRLDIIEVCALMALDGVRIGPERLALYRAGRVAAGDDAAELARANWALRRLQRGAGPLEDPAAFFDLRGSEQFASWQHRQSQLSAHPLTQSGFACAALWSEVLEQDQTLYAAIAARRLAPAGTRLTHAMRRELIGHDLTLWLTAIKRSTANALLETQRLQDWVTRAETYPLSRQTRALIPTLMRHPVLPVSLAMLETTASRASCQRGLERLDSLGLIREMTGQTRYRFWAIAL